MIPMLFFLNATATTDIYTPDTLLPYTTLFRSASAWYGGRGGGLDAAPSVLLRSFSAWVTGATMVDVGCAAGLKGSGSIGGTPTTKRRSEEHTSELQSLMRISYAVFCLK